MKKISLSSDSIVAALAVAIRLVLKTIGFSLASSNAHYVLATSIFSPPRPLSQAFNVTKKDQSNEALILSTVLIGLLQEIF